MVETFTRYDGFLVDWNFLGGRLIFFQRQLRFSQRI